MVVKIKCGVKTSYKKMTIVMRSLLAIFFILTLSSKLIAAEWSYTVRPGDSLWVICEEYSNRDGCWKHLASYNNITADVLRVGQRIKMPVSWLKRAPIALQVLYVNGDVSVRGRVKGVLRPLQVNEALPVGSVIYTREGSTTLRFMDGSVLVMHQDSHLVIDAVSAIRQTKAANIEMRLPSGEIEVAVPVQQPRTRMQISTPSSVAAVRGTQFRLDVDSEAEQTKNEVLHGAVNLSSEQGSVDLVKGYGSIAAEGSPPMDPVRLPPPPHWNMACDDPGVVEWQTAEPALQYRVVVLEQDRSVDKVVKRYLTSDSSLLLNDLDQGCYRLKINSVDRFGFNGIESERGFCLNDSLDEPVIQEASFVENLVTLNWQEVKGASSYRVQLAADFAFNDILVDDKTENLSIELKVSGYERVFMRLRAVDDSGKVFSAFSAGQPLNELESKNTLYGLLGAALLLLAL